MNIQEEIRALNLGSQVRQLRQRRDLTLQDVSDATGLSKPLLSQIENNIAAPPIATLLKISKALGVNIGHFFQDSPSTSRIVVVRQEERHRAMSRIFEEADKVGYRYESLAYPMADKHMEPFIVEIEPNREDELQFYNHRGEEFLFVMEGEVEFRGANQVIVLYNGDSIYFHSSIPHSVRCVGERAAKALAVIYSY